MFRSPRLCCVTDYCGCDPKSYWPVHLDIGASQMAVIFTECACLGISCPWCTLGILGSYNPQAYTFCIWVPLGSLYVDLRTLSTLRSIHRIVLRPSEVDLQCAFLYISYQRQSILKTHCVTSWILGLHCALVYLSAFEVARLQHVCIRSLYLHNLYLCGSWAFGFTRCLLVWFSNWLHTMWTCVSGKNPDLHSIHE